MFPLQVIKTRKSTNLKCLKVELNIILNLTCLYSTFQLKYFNISYLVTQPLSLLTTGSVNFWNTLKKSSEYPLFRLEKKDFSNLLKETHNEGKKKKKLF